MTQEINKRLYERFDQEVEFFFQYSLLTALDFSKESKEEEKPKRCDAFTKNVSAEGLCFTSLEKLEKGTPIRLEMALREDQEPLRMNGEVRWCQSTRPGYEDDENTMYDTGVKLWTVQGTYVPDTIYYDEQYHIIWSVVLDSVLGKIKEFKKLKGLS